jgi:hypothetical protein
MNAANLACVTLQLHGVTPVFHPRFSAVLTLRKQWYGMTQKDYLAIEFPNDLPTVLRLRSEDPVFDEICGDLELLGQDFESLSAKEGLLEDGAHLDILESMQALRQEVVEILLSKGNAVAD